jgi:hypothetical protein
LAQKTLVALKVKNLFKVVASQCVPTINFAINWVDVVTSINRAKVISIGLMDVVYPSVAAKKND